MNSGTFLSFGTFTSTSANNHPQTLIFLLVFIQSGTLLQTNSTTRIRSTFFYLPTNLQQFVLTYPTPEKPNLIFITETNRNGAHKRKKATPESNRIESTEQTKTTKRRQKFSHGFFNGTIYTWFTSRWEAFVIEAVQHVQFSCLLLLRLKLFRFFRDKLPHNCRFSIT